MMGQADVRPDNEQISTATLRAEIMWDALRFIRDLATEEYGFVKVGTGSEIVLRKIIQRANDALGE
jgi:hypothetical protein